MFRKLRNWLNAADYTPTHEERLNSAFAMQGYAVDIFTTAAADLEDAANQFGVLADDADTTAGELARVAGTARRSAADAKRKATTIKELFA